MTEPPKRAERSPHAIVLRIVVLSDSSRSEQLHLLLNSKPAGSELGRDTVDKHISVFLSAN